MTEQMARAAAFKALHEQPGAFLIPNPWDAGTARLLENLGFDALATTSLGVANTHGRRRCTGQEVLDNIRVICQATSLPVNADLEDGFAAAPEEAARMIPAAAAAGAVGGSIEDATGDRAAPIYEFALAVARIEAAVEAARALPVPFLLTARAENLLHGRQDLDDTIKRLQAFEAAGADVLYAPGLRSREEIQTVVSAVSKPFNVVMGMADPSITLAELDEIGVKRVSIGGALSRLALKAFLDGANEMRARRFGFVRDLASIQDLHAAFTD